MAALIGSRIQHSSPFIVLSRGIKEALQLDRRGEETAAYLLSRGLRQVKVSRDEVDFLLREGAADNVFSIAADRSARVFRLLWRFAIDAVELPLELPLHSGGRKGVRRMSRMLRSGVELVDYAKRARRRGGRVISSLSSTVSSVKSAGRTLLSALQQRLHRS